MFLDDFPVALKPNSTAYIVFYKKWLNTLLEYCMKLFTWNGLPDTIPQKEIETRLFLYGMCGINYTRYTKELVACNIHFDGVTHYYDVFTHYNYTTPKTGGRCEIDVDGVVIDNNMIRNAFFNTLHCYASQLAHADVTFICCNVNGRSTTAVTAINAAAKNTADDYIQSQYNGRPSSLVDKAFNTIEIRDTFTRNSINTREIIDTRQLILSEFLELIGIKKSAEKRERLIMAETEVNDELLRLNIQNMLDSRRAGAEKVNKMFSTNITVTCNIKDGLKKEESKTEEIKETEETANGSE